MVTQICTLKFADGHVITATVTAASPTGNETITYTGDIRRLATGLILQRRPRTWGHLANFRLWRI